MKPPTLLIQNFGQIEESRLTFGDLTVFVGPQATGKSIALQLLKLMVDAGQVQEVMGKYGIDWSGELPDFLDAYFGEGMRSIWKDTTRIVWEGDDIDLLQIAKRKAKEENVFFIPAQRVLTRSRPTTRPIPPRRSYRERFRDKPWEWTRGNRWPRRVADKARFVRETYGNRSEGLGKPQTEIGFPVSEKQGYFYSPSGKLTSDWATASKASRTMAKGAMCLVPYSRYGT